MLASSRYITNTNAHVHRQLISLHSGAGVKLGDMAVCLSL